MTDVIDLSAHDRSLGRPFIPMDPVYHVERSDWGLGVVRSISDEGAVTVDWWGSPFGYLQATHYPDALVHYRVRNCEEKPATPSPDLVERMVANIRAWAERCKAVPDWLFSSDSTDQSFVATLNESRAILAELVSVDPDLELARDIAASQDGLSALQRESYRKGYGDETIAVEVALAAIKRVRAEKSG